MGLRAPPAGDVEALTELDALHRLNAHERLREQPVELAVPVHVAAQADGHAVREDLDDPPDRVTRLRGRLHLRDHGGLGLAVEAAHG